MTTNLIDYNEVQAILQEVEYKKGEWKLKKKIWSNASDTEKDYKVGDRVWPAGEEFKSYFTVKQIKEVGTKFYMDGAVICSTDKGAERIYELDMIIKHPSQEFKDTTFKKKRKK
jgi:hypothetical protein